jgi:signal transduction histidine kinase
VSRHRLLRLAGAAGALVVALVLAAATTLLLLGRLPEGRDRDLVVPAVAGAVVAALAFRPVRARTVAGGRRPEEIVRRFGERAAAGVDERELLLELADAVRRTLSARSADVWTGVPGLLERTASTPDRPHATVTVTGPGVEVLCRSGVVGLAWLELWLPELLDGRTPGQQLRLAPACHSGVLLGFVAVERASDDPPFTEADDATLAAVGDRLGVVLHNRRLDDALQATLDDLRVTNEELRASRSRLVAAADAERRRIERDIHDGAQQHLVALAVNVGLARDLIRDDPDAADRILAEAGDAVKTTIQELRELAQGVYPSLLADAGLVDALRSAARRAAPEVVVTADEVGRYRAEVEAATYFACLEALQNAAKHAPGAPVRLILSGGDRSLHVEVADDGPGFDPATTARGAGLANIADRIGAVGGRAAWDTAPGRGTRLVLDVPEAR